MSRKLGDPCRYERPLDVLFRLDELGLPPITMTAAGLQRRLDFHERTA